MIGFPPTFDQMGNFPNAALLEHGAGPFTTGTVTVQITMGNPFDPERRAEGLRQPDCGGCGNIQVVSGILVNGINGPRALARSGGR